MVSGNPLMDMNGGLKVYNYIIDAYSNFLT